MTVKTLEDALSADEQDALIVPSVTRNGIIRYRCGRPDCNHLRPAFALRDCRPGGLGFVCDDCEGRVFRAIFG